MLTCTVLTGCSCFCFFLTRSPCLNYPRYKLAEFYFRTGDYELALDQCHGIITNNCETVNPGQPYAGQAARMVEMIAKAGGATQPVEGDMP